MEHCGTAGLLFHQATLHASGNVTEGHGIQGELEFSVSWASPVPGIPHPQISLCFELVFPSLWPRDTSLPLSSSCDFLDREGPIDRKGERAYKIGLVGRCGERQKARWGWGENWFREKANCLRSYLFSDKSRTLDAETKDMETLFFYSKFSFLDKCPSINTYQYLLLSPYSQKHKYIFFK